MRSDLDTYGKLAAFLHTRNKPVPRKKIGPNTYAERLGPDTIGVRLHDTVIVTHRPDRITINTGGWLTPTTMDRINACVPAPWRLISVEGTWRLRRGREWRTEAPSWHFTEGISLKLHNLVMDWSLDMDTCLSEAECIRVERHNDAVRKMLGRLLKGDLVRDDSDPCTLCKVKQWVTADGRPHDRPRAITFGDAMGDTHHLIDHVHAGTVSTPLIQAALAERGYRHDIQHASDTVKRSLRAYLSNRLLIGGAVPAHGRKPVPYTGVEAA